MAAAAPEPMRRSYACLSAAGPAVAPGKRRQRPAADWRSQGLTGGQSADSFHKEQQDLFDGSLAKAADVDYMRSTSHRARPLNPERAHPTTSNHHRPSGCEEGTFSAYGRLANSPTHPPADSSSTSVTSLSRTCDDESRSSDSIYLAESMFDATLSPNGSLSGLYSPTARLKGQEAQLDKRLQHIHPGRSHTSISPTTRRPSSSTLSSHCSSIVETPARSQCPSQTSLINTPSPGVDRHSRRSARQQDQSLHKTNYESGCGQQSRNVRLASQPLGGGGGVGCSRSRELCGISSHKESESDNMMDRYVDSRDLEDSREVVSEVSYGSNRRPLNNETTASPPSRKKPKGVSDLPSGSWHTNCFESDNRSEERSSVNAHYSRERQSQKPHHRAYRQREESSSNFNFNRTPDGNAKREREGEAPCRGVPSLQELSQEFTYEELSKATHGFDKSRRLGTGANGCVYWGILRSGTEVAVKALKACENSGFEEEVRVLSRCRHPNLVTLLGWGRQAEQRFIVYEFLSGGDLCMQLQKCARGIETGFDWKSRMAVAVGTCQGISYLHSCRPKVFHRDIKAANILLNEHGVAKLGDFGLACVAEAAMQSKSVDKAEGTPGYADPQYVQTLQVNEPREVYSLGMLLFELLTSRPPAAYVKVDKLRERKLSESLSDAQDAAGEDSRGAGGSQKGAFEDQNISKRGELRYFLDEVDPADTEAVVRLTDPTAHFPGVVVRSLIHLAVRCIDLDESRRPRSSEAVVALKRIAALPCEEKSPNAMSQQPHRQRLNSQNPHTPPPRGMETRSTPAASLGGVSPRREDIKAARGCSAGTTPKVLHDVEPAPVTPPPDCSWVHKGFRHHQPAANDTKDRRLAVLENRKNVRPRPHEVIPSPSPQSVHASSCFSVSRRPADFPSVPRQAALFSPPVSAVCSYNSPGVASSPAGVRQSDSSTTTPSSTKSDAATTAAAAAAAVQERPGKSRARTWYDQSRQSTSRKSPADGSTTTRDTEQSYSSFSLHMPPFSMNDKPTARERLLGSACESSTRSTVSKASRCQFSSTSISRPLHLSFSDASRRQASDVSCSPKGLQEQQQLSKLGHSSSRVAGRWRSAAPHQAAAEAASHHAGIDLGDLLELNRSLAEQTRDRHSRSVCVRDRPIDSKPDPDLNGMRKLTVRKSESPASAFRSERDASRCTSWDSQDGGQYCGTPSGTQSRQFRSKTTTGPRISSAQDNQKRLITHAVERPSAGGRASVTEGCHSMGYSLASPAILTRSAKVYRTSPQQSSGREVHAEEVNAECWANDSIVDPVAIIGGNGGLGKGVRCQEANGKQQPGRQCRAPSARVRENDGLGRRQQQADDGCDRNHQRGGSSANLQPSQCGEAHQSSHVPTRVSVEDSKTEQMLGRQLYRLHFVSDVTLSSAEEGGIDTHLHSESDPSLINRAVSALAHTLRSTKGICDVHKNGFLPSGSCLSPGMQSHRYLLSAASMSETLFSVDTFQEDVYGRRVVGFNNLLKPLMPEDWFTCVSRRHFAIHACFALQSAPQAATNRDFRYSSKGRKSSAVENPLIASVIFRYECLSPNGGGINGRALVAGDTMYLHDGDMIHIFSPSASLALGHKGKVDNQWGRQQSRNDISETTAAVAPLPAVSTNNDIRDLTSDGSCSKRSPDRPRLSGRKADRAASISPPNQQEMLSYPCLAGFRFCVDHAATERISKEVVSKVDRLFLNRTR